MVPSQYSNTVSIIWNTVFLSYVVGNIKWGVDMFIKIIDYQGTNHLINTSDIFHMELSNYVGTKEMANLVLYGRGHNSAYEIYICYRAPIKEALDKLNSIEAYLNNLQNSGV